MIYTKQFLLDFIDILNDMSSYLLLGFFFAGLLKVFVPQSFIDKHLGKRTLKSVIYATLLGVPLPLCSCGVIPTGVSFYKNGMGKGATVSFLISTPQTGIDSILVTYSLLGLPFAIIRPIIALFSGVFGGVITNLVDKQEYKAFKPQFSLIGLNNTVNQQEISEDQGAACCSSCDIPTENEKQHFKLYAIFRYAFVDFLQDISKWLIIGLLLAAFISVLVPDNFFEYFKGNPLLEMLMVLMVSIPLYVCATSSVPIASVLMLKGLSPGAALVFLMAGPATNAATITVLRKALGKKTMWTYLVSIIVAAISFGLFINYLLPRAWFDISQFKQVVHHHKMLPEYLKWVSSIVLVLLMINGYIQKTRKQKNTKINKNMDEKRVIVNGMSCNHCKNSVEKNIGALPCIKFARVDLEHKQLYLEGQNIDLDLIRDELDRLGFEYGGETS